MESQSSIPLRLPKSQLFSYSVGHALNDLTASMWFSYLLIYFHKVISFDNSLAGALMLLGQIVDAICTPFVGYESDRTKGLWKIGKRKTWHLIGSICVLGSFTFVFNQCITCSHAPDWSRFIYYAPFVVIFQFGWASVQISHLSLIPELTENEHERVELNGFRYACTVLCNLLVYGIFWLIFNVQHVAGDTNMLSVKDAPRFQLLVFIILGIGLVFVIVFHLGTKERVRENTSINAVGGESLAATIERSTENRNKMAWKCWLKEHQFYQVAAIYMCTRLVVNISQVYLPMYLTESLKENKEFIAIIPLVVYVSGFFTSLLMRFVNKILGRKLTFALGAVLIVASSVALYCIQPSASKYVYGAAVLIGIGGSTMSVTALAMTADLIKNNIESGAFVYGAMSFVDKLTNGAAVMLVQEFHPCFGCCAACVWYYRDVVTFLPGGAAMLALVVLATLIPQQIGTRRKNVMKRMKTVFNQENEVSVPGTEKHTEGENSESDPLLSTAERGVAFYGT
ncbi:major facilitator superfamily domain-containing protein 12-like isoform X2 [Liolophura sinensis]|uniref:major facilitator superfamily domain-containing protein 12-like isoform X2 n=1 Tax=Liolophura sinensis TaxID=3198878 RepID=UPI003159047D